MGKRGPAPKPTALRLIDGDQESRINRNEPVARPGEVVAPPGLSKEVRAVWDYTVAELEHMSIAVPADRDSLACYCEAVVKHRRASRAVAKAPIMIPTDRGAMIRNPLLQIQRDAASTVRAFAQEFGLTPSARSQIQGQREERDDDNPFADSGH